MEGSEEAPEGAEGSPEEGKEPDLEDMKAPEGGEEPEEVKTSASILNPVSFNKTNIFKWFKDNTYYLEASHDPADRVAAFKRSVETEKLPLGIFYINPDKAVFDETLPAYEEDKRPLYKREVDKAELLSLLKTRTV